MIMDTPNECAAVSTYSVGGRKLQSSTNNQTIHLSSEVVHWGYY
jgi:hypothetical protein